MIVPVILQTTLDRNENNWFPVEIEYPDATVHLPKLTYKGSEGLKLNMYYMMQDTLDVKINNYSCLFLTGKKYQHKEIDVQKTASFNRTTVTTYIAINHYTPTDPPKGALMFKYTEIPPEDRFKAYDTKLGSPIYNLDFKFIGSDEIPTYNDLTHDYIHSVEFLSESEFRVIHLAGDERMILTLVANKPDLSDSKFVFFPRDGAERMYYYHAYKYKFQQFEYMIDTYSQTLVLMINVVTEDSATLYIAEYDSTLMTVKFRELTDGGIQFRNIIRISYPTTVNLKPSKRNTIGSPYIDGISTDWVSYNDEIEDNHIDIAACNSYTELQNNFLLNCEYFNSVVNTNGDAATMPINITPLKNQLLLDDDQLRDNMTKTNHNVDFRSYTKIHSGTNQNKGLDNIYLGYESGTETIQFNPGKLTYFHTPQNMYPYERINVKDTGLVSNGATPGDTPLTSDKIFKKRAGYPKSTNHGDPFDEHTGEWLCTWLYYNPDTKEYTWLDRYYNPDALSYIGALRSPIQPSYIYISRHSTVSEAVDDTYHVYDKISDMCLSPGNWYSYYRLGRDDYTKMVNAAENLIQKGFTEYYRYPSTKLIVTDTFKDDTRYEFTGDTYGYIKESNISNNYTISFSLSSQDWAETFGTSLISNMGRSKVAIYNQRDYTSVLVVRSGNRVYIYDTDYKEINNFGIDEPFEDAQDIHVYTCYQEYVDHIYIVYMSNDTYRVCVYDYAGTKLRDKQVNIYNYLKSLTYKLPDGNFRSQLLRPGDGPYDTSIPLYDVTPTQSDNQKQDRWLMTNDDIYLKLTDRWWSDEKLWHATDIPSNKWRVMKFLARYALKINKSTLDFEVEEISLAENFDFMRRQMKPTSKPTESSYYTITQNADRDIVSRAIDNTTKISASRTGDIWSATRATYQSPKDLAPNPKHMWLCVNDRLVLNPIPDIVNVYSLTVGSHDNWYALVNHTTGPAIVYGNLADKNVNIKSLKPLNINHNDLIDAHTTPRGDDEIVVYSSQDKQIHKYTSDVTFKSQITMPDPIFDFLPCSSVCNLHKIRNSLMQSTNTLHFMCDLTNSRNINHTVSTCISVDVSKYKPGVKHFTHTVDSSAGTATVLVNGMPVEQQKYEPLMYSQSDNVLASRISVGQPAYLNGSTVREILSDSNAQNLMLSNCCMSNVYTYNSAITFHECRALYKLISDIKPVKIGLPTGNRNYIDGISKMYKHKLPGRKSEVFDINLYTTTLTNTDLMKRITDRVVSVLGTEVPVNFTPRNLNWSKGTPIDADINSFALDNVFRIYESCEIPPSPTPTVTPTMTPSVTPSVTPPAATPTPTQTVTPSVTPSLTPSVTPTLTATTTPTPTITPTNDVVEPPLPPDDPLITPTPTVTPTLTSTPTTTPTPTNTPTETPVPPPEPPPAPTVTPTVTPTLTPSVTPTLTPSVTSTPATTPEVTSTPAVTPTLTPTSSAPEDCCAGFINTISTTGTLDPQNPVNGLSTGMFEAGGQLCFHAINITGAPGRYNVMAGDVLGVINVTGVFTNDEVVYKSPTGTCYKGNLNTQSGIIILTEV